MSQILFNVVMENGIRTWLAMTVEDQRVAHDVFGASVRRCLVVLYADDSMVGSRYPDWLQQLMNVLVGLFLRYSLTGNVAKSSLMTFQPGALRLGMSVDSKALKCTGVVDSYFCEAPMTNPFSGVCSLDHRGVYNGTLLRHAYDGTGNRLEPVSGQSDRTPYAGIQCDVSAGNKAVSLPLSWMPGVFSCVEWLALELQQPALGG